MRCLGGPGHAPPDMCQPGWPSADGTMLLHNYLSAIGSGILFFIPSANMSLAVTPWNDTDSR